MNDRVFSPPDLESARADVVANGVPGHVAIIMDGNGRWAERQGLPRLTGHREGAKSVRDVVEAATRLGIRHLTLYAFSSQNWARPAGEVGGLMALLREFLDLERETLMNNRVRLEAIGDLSRLPPQVRLPLAAVRKLTRDNDGLTLTLALSYGGREEIVEACRTLAREVEDGSLLADDIDEAKVRERLSSGKLPDPDLVIRTSGEMRISNFLLFHLAYSEIVVTELAWPDFREPALLQAIAEYQKRERRYGRTSAQVATAVARHLSPEPVV